MRSGLGRIGVCSWSLRPGSPADLAARASATGVQAVQLAFEPLLAGEWSERDTRAALEAAGLEPLSGMLAMRGEDYSSIAAIRRTGGLRPTEHWPANLEAAGRAAGLARRLGLSLVSFHAGFIPESAEAPERGVLLARLGAVVERFAEAGVGVALETGQESVETLLEVLHELDRPTLGVNFDPANLLLYGSGEPLAALDALRPHLRQVHVKDARPSGVPDVWGEEVRVGTGAVDWPALLARLAGAGAGPIDLIIEREAGEDRVADVVAARELIERCRA